MRNLWICGAAVLLVACGAPDEQVTKAPDEVATETSPEVTAPEVTAPETLAPTEGTRANPLPFGETAAVSISESDPAWTIKVLDFVPDATDSILGENEFNEPPADGRQFAMVRIEATYVGFSEPATLFSDLTFVAVDGSNLTYDSEDSCGVAPDELDQFGQVYAGGVLEGNLCWSVASEHIESLLFGVSASFASGPPYFMALS